MARAPAFNFSHPDKLLKVLGETRRELCLASAGMENRSLVKAATDQLVSNIDELAFFLTGSRNHFHLRPCGPFGEGRKGPPPE